MSQNQLKLLANIGLVILMIGLCLWPILDTLADEDPYVCDAIIDTYISQENPTANYGSITPLIVNGSIQGFTEDRSILIKWDIEGSDIPQGSPVTFASINYMISDSPFNSSRQAYQLYEMKRDWVEAEATWEASSTGNSWQIAGAQGSDDRGSTVLGETVISRNLLLGHQALTFNPDGLDLIQSWVDNPLTNNGIIISNSNNIDSLKFSSREVAENDRPKLIVFTKIYPYLQDVTQNSIKVMWYTSTPSIGTVEYGPTDSYGSPEMETEAHNIHEVLITGLQPDTIYHYRINSDDLSSDDNTFKTAPPSDNSFTFIAYADTQGLRSGCDFHVGHEEAVNSMLSHNPRSMIICAGDLCYDGSEDEWQPQFFIPGRNILKDNVLYTVLGNHDAPNIAKYENYFEPPDIGGSGTELYYSFNYGNTHFVMLDTNRDYTIGSDQYNWFSEDLDSPAARDATWIIVVAHHPAYSSGSAHGSNEDIIQDIVPLFETKGVDMYISGHEHIYERSYKNGIYYVITGPSGGSPRYLQPNPNPYSEYNKGMSYHYCLIETGTDKIIVNAYDENGDNFDTFIVGSDLVQPILTADINGNGQDEVVVDFGDQQGIFVRNDSGVWSHLHGASPETMIAGDLNGDGKDEVIVDFGSQKGIWISYNDGTWTNIHSKSPDSMVIGDINGDTCDEVIADFGKGYGIWVYLDGIWFHMHGISPKSMATGDLNADGKDEIIVDFGSMHGIWVRFGDGSWTQIHSLSPKLMTTGNIDGDGGEEVIINFDSFLGIWARYDNNDLVHLYEARPELMVTADLDGDGTDEIVMDFGSSKGIWVVYGDGTYSNINELSPELMTKGDLDGNGQDELVVDFGPDKNIWVRNDDGSWSRIHGLSP